MRKPKQLLKTVSVRLGCSCRRPKLSSVFSPKPKSKLPKYHQRHQHHQHQHPVSYYYSSSTSSSAQTTSSFFSPFIDYPSSSSSDVVQQGLQDPYYVDGGFGREVGNKTVAVEKESEDPYLDFRQSMLQMIVENGIYSKDELKELLNCFLQLNSASLHGVIIRVFTEIWNGFFFSTATAASAPAAPTTVNGITRRRHAW
ncbi:hypothetical protein Dimus_034781 [Dionaea muscipula]